MYLRAQTKRKTSPSSIYN